MKKKKKISKKMSFSSLLEKFPEAGEILMQEGLHCLGCAISAYETIEQGCQAHGLDPDKIIEKLNKKIKGVKKIKK